MRKYLTVVVAGVAVPFLLAAAEKERERFGQSKEKEEEETTKKGSTQDENGSQATKASDDL